ncbi:MAG: hypothetical protein IKT47_03980 [Oscillospiraceae bacterium]|nr:hypothetical protein [Oscillospiraceae bacterium]
MQSAKLFFDKTIFKKTAKRYWPIWVLYLLVWTLAMGICTQSCVRGYIPTRFNHSSLLQLSWQLGLISAVGVSCVSAMFVHSWMYSSRSASAYSSLPICRGRLFMGITLAGFVPAVVCTFIACIVSLLVALFSGFFILSTVAQCFAVIMLEYIFFYGLATLCAVLTGNVFVIPFIYAIFNFLVVVVELLFKEFMTQFTFGASPGGVQLKIFSPIVYIVDETSEVLLNENGPLGYSDLATLNNWWAFIIYAIIGIIFIVCAMLIFRKRRMESATDVVAINALKPVFKYCLCFGCALVIGLILFTIIFGEFFTIGSPAASIVVCVCMIIGGFIGYFTAEMLIRKSFKVFRKHWKGFFISCAVIIVVITAFELDFFGYERRIPDVEDVSSVSMSIWGEPTDFTDPDEISQIILLHERIVNDKAHTEKRIYSYYKNQEYEYSDEYTTNVTISYTLANGRSFLRSYKIMYGDTDKFCSDMLNYLNRPEFIIRRIETAITAEYISHGSIYYHYRVLAENALQEDTKPAYDYTYSYSIEGNMSAEIARPIPIDESADKEYVHGSLELTSIQSRELFDSILMDAQAGNIGRIRPRNNGYNDRVNITIEMTAKVPYIDMENVHYTHEYIYIEDITEDAVHTVAALKELGIDLEALASYAIK